MSNKAIRASKFATVALLLAVGTVSISIPADAVTTKPTITISQFTFSKLSVRAGTTILVRNKDQTNHTFHILGTKIDPVVAAGKTVTVKLPTKVGSYTIHCDYHPSMTGKIKLTK